MILQQKQAKTNGVVVYEYPAARVGQRSAILGRSFKHADLVEIQARLDTATHVYATRIEAGALMVQVHDNPGPPARPIEVGEDQ